MSYWQGLGTSDTPVYLPGVWDAFTAKLVEHYGFRAALIGGYHAGAVLGSAEPLMTATELVELCRNVRRATSLPIRVDVGAGYGDPMHVVRLVKDLKQIGIDAISIEDQVYPKQAHYHNDYQEQVIALDAMVDKIAWARRAGGPDLYICGRTDTFSTHGLDEVVARCTAFLDAGADAVQAFPPTVELAQALPKAVPGPVWYANTRGNRVGRPNLTPRQAHDYGYVGLADGHIFFFAAFAAMTKAMGAFDSELGATFDGDEIAIKKEIEAVLDLDSLYEIEAETIRADL